MIPDINLLPRLEKRSGSSSLLYIVLGILTVLLLSIFSWQYFMANSELKTLTNEQSTIQAQRNQLQMEYDILLSAQTGSFEDSVVFVERVSYAVSPLIDETQSLLPDHTYLRSYSFDASSVSIAVDFESLAGIATYIKKLETSAYFTDAQLSSVSNFELDPGETGKEQVDDLEKFKEVPRYTTNITLEINHTYLSSGGGR